jgi:hypothetical protein
LRRAEGADFKITLTPPRAGKPVTLGVLKINPARRLYERLGLQRTHEDRHKVYMRLEPGG